MARGQRTLRSAELLMVGSCASTYRMENLLVKTPRIDSDAEITQENARSMSVEANVYKILGRHSRIARCIFICPTGYLVTLEFYPNGNLKAYAAAHGLRHLRKWARQMIESIEFIHQKGIRHADIRLDQWLVDCDGNARLSDFNAAGFDEHPDLGIASSKALGNETASHFMPRDPSEDSTNATDLFALGSALYELEQGSVPFAGSDDEEITQQFAQGSFPPVGGLVLGSIIVGCWTDEFISATDVLEHGQRTCGL